jgi:hypothetical protein
MCHADQRWTDALSIVLLGIPTAFKEDLQVSLAELVYGEPLRVPPRATDPNHQHCGAITPHQLPRPAYAAPSPVPAARHASPATFVHKDLRDSTHVFLQQDATRRALHTPYSGPHQVLSRRQKTFQLSARGKSITVSADRAKPVPCSTRPDMELPPPNPRRKEHLQLCPRRRATTTSRADHTLRSQRPFPGSLRHLSGHLCCVRARP